jgi:demethylmenaquinone methyltransferase/2-methoxy-6-polyprenyl-1,4-benzoquinol methylase
MPLEVNIPPDVQAAFDRAQAAGFTMSSEPTVGLLLAVLASGLPHESRMLEIGTGVGVGTAWITYGLSSRDDVEVISVEMDEGTAAIARSARWPSFVHLVHGDILSLIGDLGTFDLIFADAQGGKWFGLDRTIAALRPGAKLLVDDMEPDKWTFDEQPAKTEEVRRALLANPDLLCVELHESSGMILATRKPI